MKTMLDFLSGLAAPRLAELAAAHLPGAAAHAIGPVAVQGFPGEIGCVSFDAAGEAAPAQRTSPST